MSLIFYLGNSQFLEVDGLKDQSVTPVAYINNATATATLYDSTGAAVAGAENMTGAYQAGSNGVYRFPVDPVLFKPATGSGFTLKIDITGTGGILYHAELKAACQKRITGLEA